MVPLMSLIIVVVLSMLIVKIASVALMLTGMSSDSAKFQARSAFSGAGFTTSESEQVVNHPVRRRIVLILMLLGNAGIVTVAATLFLSFAQDKDPEHHWYESKLALASALVVALFLLWKIATSGWFDRALTNVIERMLGRYTDLEVRDYVSLFHLQGDYAVAELAVREGDWMAGNTLIDLRLSAEGVLVLGIERHDGYIGAPRGQTTLRPGDMLVLYGRESTLADLDERGTGLAGFTAHVRSLKKQHEVEVEQEKLEHAADEPQR